ncbi:hypothetical protein D3C75_1061170 [compost metagenome]
MVHIGKTVSVKFKPGITAFCNCFIGILDAPDILLLFPLVVYAVLIGVKLILSLFFYDTKGRDISPTLMFRVDISSRALLYFRNNSCIDSAATRIGSSRLLQNAFQ